MRTGAHAPKVRTRTSLDQVAISSSSPFASFRSRVSNPHNVLTPAQVIDELIQHAKDIRAARARREETGLTDVEIAFYDALAENENARRSWANLRFGPCTRVGGEHQGATFQWIGCTGRLARC